MDAEGSGEIQAEATNPLSTLHTMSTTETQSTTNGTATDPPQPPTSPSPSSLEGWEMFVLFVLVCFVAVFMVKWCAGRCSKPCKTPPPRQLPQPGSVLSNMSFENHPVEAKRSIRMQLLDDNDGYPEGPRHGDEEVVSRSRKRADQLV